MKMKIQRALTHRQVHITQMAPSFNLFLDQKPHSRRHLLTLLKHRVMRATHQILSKAIIKRTSSKSLLTPTTHRTHQRLHITPIFQSITSSKHSCQLQHLTSLSLIITHRWVVKTRTCLTQSLGGSNSKQIIFDHQTSLRHRGNYFLIFSFSVSRVSEFEWISKTFPTCPEFNCKQRRREIYFYA